MSNDDDDLLGIDLDLWAAPPPPASIADGVIARMHREVTQVTVQALPVEQAPPARPARRWWLVGGVAAAIATASMVAFALTRSGPPANARGITAGDRAAHIALGPSHADVDPDTVVSWRREGARITAQQAGGIAAWRVGEDDTLTIETGLGSIEATNASLRVEVKMLDERKTIALSAITAAAVAAVTIVVYEGVVRVRADGATTTVAPGTAYQIKAKGDNVIVEDQSLVGAAPVDPSRAEAQAEIDRLRAEIEAKEAEQQLLVKQINGLLPDNIEKADIQRAMKGLAPEIKKCAGSFKGKLLVRATVAADGRVTGVEITPESKPGPCIAELVQATPFPATKRGVTFHFPLTIDQPVASSDFSPNPFTKPADDKAACKDLEVLQTRAQEMFSMGQPSRALEVYETIYACKPSEMIARLAVASACKSKQTHKAKLYWKKLSQPGRDMLASLCAAHSIFANDLDGPAGSGRLRVGNTRPAKVLVDGVEVGMTPIDMDLPPGKHKVTFVIGADKYTFSVLVRAGETASLMKSIE